MQCKFTKEDTLAMKGIAVAIMFFHHCFNGKSRYEGIEISFAPFSEGMILSLASFAKVCVGIFVFLSAYGITVSLKKKHESNMLDADNIFQSITGRLWRILTGFWPVYLVCIAGTLLFGPERLNVYGEGIQRFVYMFLDAMGLSRLIGSPILIQTWWYMGLAIMQVLLMPLLVKIYYRFGGMWLLFMSLILPLALKLETTDTVRWLPIMVLGLWCADQNLLEKLRTWEPVRNQKVLSNLLKFIMAAAILCLAILGKNSEMGEKYLAFFDLISAIAVLIFATLFLICIPVLRRLFVLLGTYSMTMFLIHSFIRDRWFHDFTYSFRYWWLIVIVLLADSLLAAVLIEGVKKLLRYPQFVKWGEGKLAKLKTNISE